MLGICWWGVHVWKRRGGNWRNWWVRGWKDGRICMIMTGWWQWWIEHVEMKQWEGQWRECGWRDLQHAGTIPQPRPQWPQTHWFFHLIDSQFYISQCCMGQWCPSVPWHMVHFNNNMIWYDMIWYDILLFVSHSVYSMNVLIFMHFTFTSLMLRCSS